MATDEHDEREGGGEADELGPHAARAAGERIRELAEAEHARTEAEEAKDEADDSDRHSVMEPPDDHPLAGLAEPITDANLLLLGDAGAGMAPCPFCDGYGAVNPDQLLEALPDVIQKLAPFPASSIFVRCSECDGWGSVLTGGRTGDNGIQPCPKCDSHGYLDTRGDGGDGGRSTVLADVTRGYVDGELGDAFTMPPPEGVPPAAGMEWSSELGRWGYPERAA